MPPYLESIQADSAALATVIRTRTLDTPVPSCPGWTLRDLADHLGHVQRWARLAVVTAAPPDEAAIDVVPGGDEADGAALADWLAYGTAALVGALAGVPDTAPTWHPFPVAQVAGVWPRRQAHEVAVHRWDGERAVGPTTPLDPALAADFVHEYFEVIVPRVMARDSRVPPVGVLDVRLVDVSDAFRVRSSPAHVAMTSLDGTPADDVLEGAAEDVLLALWRRRALAGDHADLASDWLAFGGN